MLILAFSGGFACGALSVGLCNYIFWRATPRVDPKDGSFGIFPDPPTMAGEKKP